MASVPRDRRADGMNAVPTGSGLRLAAGGRIDRSRPITMRWDGRALPAYDGDTLASALLANSSCIGRAEFFRLGRRSQTR